MARWAITWPTSERETLAMECVYWVNVDPLHPENGSLAVFAMCWRPKFREEVRCAKTVSENSGCAKSCLYSLLAHTQKKEEKKHPRVHLATKHTTFYPHALCSGASLFSGSVTHPSTQTDHIMSHGLARDGWRL